MPTLRYRYYAFDLFVNSARADTVRSLDRKDSSALARTLTELATVFVAASWPGVTALDQVQCLHDLNDYSLRIRFNLTDGIPLGRNNSGSPVDDAVATAISYRDCVAYCPGGGGQEPFDWTIFSKQFSSWLLPWLALISQLPFGAELRMDNLMSMILTLGSPTLAGYSLILTTLNGSYVASRFSDTAFPNAKYAVQILAGLQQAPLRVVSQDGLLASLIVLPQNDRWWIDLASRINYEHTWSISAFSGIAWVTVAYLLTVIESFTSVGDKGVLVSSDGPGVASVWLWLLPMVVGWLVISPKCDGAKLRVAIEEANQIAYVAREDGFLCYASSPESRVESRRAMVFERSSSTFLYDEICSSPIFNYSRIFYWTMCVEEVAEAFHGATEHIEAKKPVNPNHQWKFIKDAADSRTIHPDNRKGEQQQIVDYCVSARFNRSGSRWGHGVFKRMVIASFMGLLLQWCTTGAAVIIVLYTPTTGLGCRSGSYIVYGLASSLVWFMMVLSSILGYCSQLSSHRVTLDDVKPTAFSSSSSQRRVHRTATLPLDSESTLTSSPTFHHLSGTLSVLLNACGKVLGTLNALWIICTCTLHFTNVFNRCLCNSSVYGRGVEYAFNVLALTDQDKSSIKNVWVGGVAMTLISSTLFIGFIWMYHKPPQPRS